MYCDNTLCVHGSLHLLALTLRNGAEAIAPPAQKLEKFNHRLHTDSPHGTISILALSYASIHTTDNWWTVYLLHPHFMSL